MLAQRVKALMPNEPWGAAAECDVAAKLGDTEMLARCVSTLKTLAPDHYETRRFHALLEKSRPGWKTALGFVALAGVLLVTGLQALMRRTRGASAVVALALAGASLGAPALARADEAEGADPAAAVDPAAVAADPTGTRAANLAETENKRAGALSKHPINEADPGSSVPTPEERDKDPLEFGYYLMDLGDMAEKAKAAGDYKKAAKVYRAMAKAVPDVPVAFVKACEQYEKAKDLEHAAEFCAAALTMKGVTLADYSHYARVVLAKPGPIPPAAVANLDLVVKHLKADAKSRDAGLDIQCTLAARLADRARLEQCAPALALMAPDSSKAIFFGWNLALLQKNYAAAEKLLARARAAAANGELSFDKEKLALMEKATLESMPPWRRGFRDWRVGASVAALLFAGLALLLLRRRGATPPNVSGPPQQVSP